MIPFSRRGGATRLPSTGDRDCFRNTTLVAARPASPGAPLPQLRRTLPTLRAVTRNSGPAVLSAPSPRPPSPNSGPTRGGGVHEGVAQDLLRVVDEDELELPTQLLRNVFEIALVARRQDHRPDPRPVRG